MLNIITMITPGERYGPLRTLFCLTTAQLKLRGSRCRPRKKCRKS